MPDVRFPGEPITSYSLPLGYDVRRGKVVLREEWKEPLRCVFAEARKGRSLEDIVFEVKPMLPRRVTFDTKTVQLILEEPAYAGRADGFDTERLVSPEEQREALSRLGAVPVETR